MAWLSVIGNVFFYIFLPFTTLFGWLLLAFSPVLHLGNYTLSAFMLPFRLLAKFETLYIYLGVAAVIGLVTGSVLHVSSSLLVSILNLTPIPEETGRSAASVRAAREQKRLEEAWKGSTSMGEPGIWKRDASKEKKYSEWLEKDLGKRIDEGLLGSTIIEEDDSEDGF